MIRSFHPVGQGAFYTEIFNRFRIVYDCGTSTSPELIKREIRSVFEKNADIDVVFISHLHRDHVNGLQYLVKYCNVRMIVLPMISRLEKIHLTIVNLIGDTYDEYVNMLIQNPREAVPESTNLVFVQSQQEEMSFEEVDETMDFSYRDIDEIYGMTTEVPSNTAFTSGRTDSWVFIPFNFQESRRAELLCEQLRDRGISTESPNEIINAWQNKGKREHLLDAYRSIPGSFNTNSMTLYSGPSGVERKNTPIMMYVNKNTWVWPYMCLDNPSCMYFGDYEATGKRKWGQFRKHYGSYWEHVNIIQVPHHGSKHNYNEEFNSIKPRINVISAGMSNTYRHPHALTLRSILVSGGVPVVVTEMIASRLQCVFEYI